MWARRPPWGECDRGAPPNGRTPSVGEAEHTALELWRGGCGFAHRDELLVRAHVEAVAGGVDVAGAFGRDGALPQLSLIHISEPTRRS
eukprot:3026163-Prymnesium_polylepis.1